MLRLKRVAVTGGLSCGKSTVCRIFGELGAYVISADEIVHQLLSSDTTFSQRIVGLLGPEILVNQKIDRSRIARIVFQNPKLLQALEQLVHPVVYKELEKEYQRQQHSPSPPPLFIAEIPLLFESGDKRKYDHTIAVIADEELCWKRLKQTTGLTKTEFNNRVKRQHSSNEKALQADYVIRNNGSLADLQEITRRLYQELLKG
jgi:dephospho-CoA kinase